MDLETNNTNVSEQDVQTTTENEQVKTYTEEEVLKLIQSESDKRVTEALKKQNRKHARRYR